MILAAHQTNFIPYLGFFYKIYSSYYMRFKYQDLTTGRLDLSRMYIKSLLENPTFLIFGASNTYYNYIIIDYMKNIGYYIPYYSTAHNTYLDLILSWGIIGSILFIGFIKSLLKFNKSNKIP